MKRRKFITLLGGAAVWPLAVRAQQQPERMRRIGVLLPAAADDAVFQTRMAVFLQELALLGWTVGRNLSIDIRWATANAAEVRRHAAELAALTLDVILATGDAAVAAGDPHRADRIPDRRRSGCRRLRREPGAAWRQ
jgi:putative ABC transport system substrate-binding protein